jgi:hypothetical protein
MHLTTRRSTGQALCTSPFFPQRTEAKPGQETKSGGFFPSQGKVAHAHSLKAFATEDATSD